ncbi:MAG: YlxR family protein [Oscillochloris sp.]|nr:YlxR family protein [Oscillochloris sp.]
MAQTENKQRGPRVKHVPQRTCIACRRTDAKRGLIRLVRTPDGRAEVDSTGKRHGRGAYLCHTLACWEAAIKRHALERALRIDPLSADNQQDLLVYVRGLPLAEEAVPTNDHGDASPQDVRV